MGEYKRDISARLSSVLRVHESIDGSSVSDIYEALLAGDGLDRLVTMDRTFALIGYG